MREYGVAETVDHTLTPVADAVRKAHPDGIDVLLDLASDRDAFAKLAALVRPGGKAVTTKFVADTGALKPAGVTGVNFALHDFERSGGGLSLASSELLDRVAQAVSTGRIMAPPITRISLEDAPAVLSAADREGTEGKTVITL